MLGKYSFGAQEKQAILTAIGVLSWTSLAKSRIKNLKEKREKREKGERE